MGKLKFLNKKYSIWVILVILIVMASLIIVYFQGNSELSSYTGNGISAVSSESSIPPVDLEKQVNDTYQYVIGIPEDWKRVIKNGYETYVHSATATSVQIQISKYTPDILLVSGESESARLLSENYILYSFQKYDATTYSIIYQKDNSNNTKTIYIEMTYFDREDIVRVVYTVNSRHYEQMSNVITAIIDSFVWDKSNPFPSGMGLYYSVYGNYEFAYPSDWIIGTSGNAYLVQDEKTGATISIVAVQNSVSYKDYSKLDYTNYTSKSRNNFLLQTYNATDNIIYAQSTYTIDNTPMILTQYLLTSGTYEYAITFETPRSAFDSQAQLFGNIINTFRYF